MKKQKVNKCKSQMLASFGRSNEKSRNSASDDAYISLQNNTKSTPKPDCPSQKMAITLPSLSTAYDQAEVFDRSAAVMATSVLDNVGIVSPIILSKMIDQSKI